MHTFMVACVDRGNAQQLVSAELVFLSMRVEQGHRKKNVQWNVYTGTGICSRAESSDEVQRKRKTEGI